ncbi:MAG: DUF3179 domain-containing (seleno)protein [Acidimicrobiia bacterium]
MKTLLLVAGMVAIGACGAREGDAAFTPTSDPPGYEYPAAPPIGDGSVDPSVATAWTRIVESLRERALDGEAVSRLADAGDARVAWLVSDAMRFVPPGPDTDALVEAFVELTGVDPAADPDFASGAWRSVTNHLIAWDRPAPPDYREQKAELFLLVEPHWAPFFADAESAIDWRLVSWGGVLIDERELGDPESCLRGCIPALDDPALTPADQGDWYPDDAIVFGIVEGDEAVALPRNIMEVHEMVNMTLGGRRLGIPYCTLCGSAQAYYTDQVPGGFEQPVLRTSGLLSRSNKVMYDLRTRSVFDTFTGEALSGPLREAGVVLAQTTVVASTWAEWRAAHPDTLIVAEDGGIFRTYPLDPLGGRDDDGPIFPIGPVDPRLPVQAQVVGVVTEQGQALAFPVDAARAALAEGRSVELGGVELVGDGGGFRASAGDSELPTHQAFWFAWSQFHRDTAVWSPIGAP